MLVNGNYQVCSFGENRTRFQMRFMHSHMKKLFTFVLALENYLSGPLSHSQATLKQYNLEDPLSF